MLKKETQKRSISFKFNILLCFRYLKKINNFDLNNLYNNIKYIEPPS